MKYDVQLCEVLRCSQTAENTFDYTVLAPKLAEVAQPGQLSLIHISRTADRFWKTCTRGSRSTSVLRMPSGCCMKTHAEF